MRDAMSWDEGLAGASPSSASACASRASKVLNMRSAILV